VTMFPSALPLEPVRTVTLPGHIYGLSMSTAGSVTTFTVNGGVAADSTGVDALSLPSVYTKDANLSWAVGSGNGCLDTGNIAASTWYHVHLIKRTDTNVVDVLVSLSPTAPT